MVPPAGDVSDRLEQIERRLAALEAAAGRSNADPPVAADPEPYWALRQLRAVAPDAGAVLFTGSVQLPGAEHYEWQQTWPAEALLESDWTLRAPELAALAQPARLQILRQVLGGGHSATDLQAVEGIESTGQLYHHVRQLVAAGWLRTAGRGRYVVPPERVVPLLVIIACIQR